MGEKIAISALDRNKACPHRPEAAFDLLEAFHHLLARDGPRQDVLDENGVHGVTPIRVLIAANNTIGDVRRPRRDAEGWRHANGLRENRRVGDVESGMVVNLAATVDHPFVRIVGNPAPACGMRR